MLSSVLSGVRQLRVPLASGSMWLVVLWLHFGERLANFAERLGASLPDTVDLADVPVAIWISALAFVAYLVGATLLIPSGLGRISGAHAHESAVLERTTSVVRFIAIKFGLDQRFAYSITHGVYYSTFRDLDRNLRMRLPDLHDAERHGLAGSVIFDIRQLAARLEIKSPAVYERYDRLVSEAEFRLNVAPPLFLLALAARPELGGLAILVACAAVLMAVRGLSLIYESRSALVDALIAGGTDSSILERAAPSSVPAKDSIAMQGADLPSST